MSVGKVGSVSRAQVAKYLRIESDILAAIKDGTLKPGDKLPGQSEMRRRYDVSAITVRKAYADLVNDGYLVGVRGSGTYVARQQMIRSLTSISFSEELRQQGYDIGMIVDAVTTETNGAIAKHLDIDGSIDITKVARLRIANGEPAVYQISYVPSTILSEESAQAIYEAGSFYDVLTRNEIYPRWVTETYSVRAIENPQICAAMGVEVGYFCFFVRRTTFTEDNQIVEYSESYFNRDWYSVTVNIHA